MNLKSLFFIVVFLFIVLKVNATDVNRQDSIIITPCGEMSLKISHNHDSGVYTVLLKETYNPPQLYLQEHPFVEELPAIAVGSKNIFSNLLKQKLSVVCEYITNGLLYDFDLYILLDDKKLYNEKGFYVYFRACSLKEVRIALKELTKDCRLIETIREGCDLLYEQVPPTVRYEDLSKFEQSLVNEGKAIHFLPINVRINKEDLK